MKVYITSDERYPDFVMKPMDKNRSDTYTYWDCADIPDEIYAEYQKISERYDALQVLLEAYADGDNLTIIEKLAEFKGLLK